jgi:dCTP deaminase
MSVLSDKWIKKNARTKGMIRPFVSKQIRKGKISFGLSSYGYNVYYKTLTSGNFCTY